MVTADSMKLEGRVEVDETFFGSPRPGAKGSGALSKTPIAGALEVSDHGWGRACLAVIGGASKDSLQSFVQINIDVYPPALTI